MRRALLASAAVGAAAVAVAVPVLAQDPAPEPFRPVTGSEARAAVQRVVDLTAQGRFDQVCREAHAQCAGQSSAGRVSAYAPRADRPPTVRCTFALPGHLEGGAWGDGHVVVLQGRDARDRPYVSQQLVVREGDVVKVHEPAFWYGIAYNGFGGVRGAAWSAALGEGTTEPSFTRRMTDRAARSCDDPAGYLAEVAPAEGPGRPSASRA